MIFSPTRFAANICLTLEAVIIAGSVKANSCSNMLLLSVVMGGGLIFSSRTGVSSRLMCFCLTLKLQMNSGRKLESIHLNILDLLKDIFHLSCFVRNKGLFTV